MQLLPTKDIDQAVGAASDLVRNWLDMRTANTIGADRYFHCKGNCEAASRGPTAKSVSQYLSGLREGSQLIARRERLADARSDLYANKIGLEAPGRRDFESCDKSCRPLWPRSASKP